MYFLTAKVLRTLRLNEINLESRDVDVIIKDAKNS